jgi:hypothetical protein
MPIEIEELENILENDNHTILNTTYINIKKNKNDIIQKLNLERNVLKDYNNKLKNYRYIDEINDIVLGNYCRWIDLNDNNLELKKGGFLSCINISENGPYACIKTFNKCISIKINEVILFQKFNNQENVLLNVMKYLEK